MAELSKEERFGRYEEMAKLGKYTELATVASYNEDKVYMTWSASGDACSECAALDGEVRLAEDWDEHPPLHEHCDCSLDVSDEPPEEAEDESDDSESQDQVPESEEDDSEENADTSADDEAASEEQTAAPSSEENADASSDEVKDDNTTGKAQEETKNPEDAPDKTVNTENSESKEQARTDATVEKTGTGSEDDKEKGAEKDTEKTADTASDKSDAKEAETKEVGQKTETEAATSDKKNSRFGDNTPIPEEYRERLNNALDKAIELVKSGSNSSFETYRSGVVEALKNMVFNSVFGAEDFKGRFLKFGSKNSEDEKGQQVKGVVARAGAIRHNPDVWLDQFALGTMSEQDLLIILVHEALHIAGAYDRILDDSEWPPLAYSELGMRSIAMELLGLDDETW